jgi:hypothetical protein
MYHDELVVFGSPWAELNVVIFHLSTSSDEGVSAGKCVYVVVVVVVFEVMEADVELVVSAITLRLLQLLLESVYRLPR